MLNRSEKKTYFGFSQQYPFIIKALQVTLELGKRLF
jgi:hypothetical protein